MRIFADKIYKPVIDGFNHLLWPSVCLNCSQRTAEADKFLCRDCWDGLSESLGGDYCPTCGRDATRYGLVNNRCPNCINEQFHFDGIARAGIYTSPIREMILAFKLSDKTELDIIFSLLANSALPSVEFFDSIDYFVPVPVHWTTRIVRGYNHTQLIAKKIEHPTAKINTDLVKIRQTKDQTLLASPKKRAANVRDAFAVRDGHDFAGKKICLIDDIKTSGATINECAKTLKQAGAKKIYAFVLSSASRNL
ncbi:MAG: ComF family protein [Phycisphaerae bacterium]|nr:ComF family protein [Phycisphaerae bacterium]